MIAVLFARSDSIYKTFPDCDVYDMERDARKWPGGTSLVAHPPCRAWGGLRHMATRVRPDEKELAIYSINQIRKYGGVLEHPRRSSLWPHMGLPKPGAGFDSFGGFSIGVYQQWWGHKAEKATLLYICGCKPTDLPPIPLTLDYAQYVIGTSKKRRHIPETKKWEREATPIAFAEWLCEVARRCAK